jgi:hypothetical protein
LHDRRVGISVTMVFRKDFGGLVYPTFHYEPPRLFILVSIGCGRHSD